MQSNNRVVCMNEKMQSNNRVVCMHENDAK